MSEADRQARRGAHYRNGTAPAVPPQRGMMLWCQAYVRSLSIT